MSYWQDSKQIKLIREYCVNVCVEYCKMKGEPMPLSEGVRLVKAAIARERLMRMSLDPDLTIRRRFNQAQNPKTYEGARPELIWVGQRAMNGIWDSYYMPNPFLLDEETNAKLKKFIPLSRHEGKQAELFG